jgi:FMN-dependent NADH-azoreductase
MMMARLLHIDSSPMGAASLSRRLTDAYVAGWRQAHPGGEVIVRDLCRLEIPPIDAAWTAANFTPKASRSAQQNALLALSTTLTTELRAADEYVIGVPMHNWGPSARFKLWVDQLVRQEETVEATPSGPRGLLGGRQATFVITAGARYGAGDAQSHGNFVEPWLRMLFAYLGVVNQRFVLADGAIDVLTGKTAPETFLAPHLEAVRALSGPHA